MNQIRSPEPLHGAARTQAQAAGTFAQLATALLAWGPGALAALLLAGCAVGPNFKKPAPPEVQGYTSTPLATTIGTTNVGGGEPQRFVEGHDLSGQWWTLFHSKPLNALIELSLSNNPSIKAAQAALTVAKETVLAQNGAFYPTVSGSFSASRQATPAVLAPIPNANEFTYSLFTPQLTISYVPDVFGLNRRTVESLKAQEAAARFALVATHITLTANAGNSALAIDRLFSSGTGLWGLGATVAQPVFEGGSLLHRQRAAQAACRQAAEQYRSTVLTAFQNVADTLNALEQDADALRAAATAKDAASLTLDLARRQFQSGYANYLALLSAEQTYLQALITLVQAQANRYADTAALFQALGGGWWNRPDLPKGL
jgi:outer membrane protein TolC